MGRVVRMDRNTTAACCIPQSNLMKVMSLSSAIFGAPMTLISSILTYSPDLPTTLSKDENTSIFMQHKPFQILIFVGALQTIFSVWLLWARDKRRAAKLWTLGHFLCFCGILLYLWNLLAAKPVTNHYLRLYFYFVGVDFCNILFMTLIMIEILLRPMSSDIDHGSIMRRESNGSSISLRSKDHYEYKV
ncbi:unnamed protein product [Orchesella dallaii]|uniref:Uncharacterized protein n=1 Tax=Orchesella dallaii TaxID=48710 RepID=A0ABP1S2Z6_9HEXA